MKSLRNSYSASMRVPRKLALETGKNKINDREAIGRSLPFIDVNTATAGRLVVRDPITGLGELPEERDIFQGSRLRAKSTGSTTSDVPRNPIQMEGDLGEEYNCLYTKKTLICKPRSHRDIITLEGDLGDELDPIRQYGGRVRHFASPCEKRDPIAGVGDFGPREWDPIWHDHGKLHIPRPEHVKRDPITHSVPMENMGEKTERSFIRHFPDRINRDDPINHIQADGSLASSSSRSSMRRIQPARGRPNPITHQMSNYGSSEMPPLAQDLNTERFTLRHFPEAQKRTNPITHSAAISEGADNCASLDSLLNLIGASSPASGKNRNPISGEGMEEKDYTDLLKVNEMYCFRNFLLPRNHPHWEPASSNRSLNTPTAKKGPVRGKSTPSLHEKK